MKIKLTTGKEIETRTKRMLRVLRKVKGPKQSSRVRNRVFMVIKQMKPGKHRISKILAYGALVCFGALGFWLYSKNKTLPQTRTATK